MELEDLLQCSEEEIKDLIIDYLKLAPEEKIKQNFEMFLYAHVRCRGCDMINDYDALNDEMVCEQCQIDGVKF